MEDKIIRDTLTKLRKELPENEKEDYFDIHKDRYMAVLKLIDFDGKKPKILDVGIYPGHISLCLNKLGFQVFGISKGKGTSLGDSLINKFDNLRKKGIILKKCDIEKHKFPFKDSTFDYVLFSETIEHLSSHPKIVLKEIFRVLKKDGKLILTAPNIAYLPNRIRLLFGKPISDLENFYRTIPYSGHKREFTMKEIEYLIKEDFIILKKNFIMCQWGGDKTQGFIRYWLKTLLLIPVFFKKSFRSTIIILAQKIIKNT